jgi:hypothetical protein
MVTSDFMGKTGSFGAYVVWETAYTSKDLHQSQP